MQDTEAAGPSTAMRHSVRHKLVHGLALGFGFAIGAVAVIMTADAVKEHLSASNSAETSPSTVWRKRFTSDAKLTVEHMELRSTRWNLFVLGSVRNDGPDSWQFVRLEVQLFDQDAHLVHLCTGSINGAVRPASSRYCSVDCNGSEVEPIPAYKSYEVKVVDADYEMENGA